MAGGIVTPHMVATVSNYGCLGFIAGGYLSPQQLNEFIQSTTLLTKNPFGVNIFIDHANTSNSYVKSTEILAVETDLGILQDDNIMLPTQYPESDYIDIILNNHVPIVSCTFGLFSDTSLARLKSHNVTILANATNITEVKACLNKKVDAIILQGTEAGGHQGSFLNYDTINLTPTIELLTQIRHQFPHLILISAGGINSTNFIHYLNNGSNYVQIGTEFLLTHESMAASCYKEYLLNHYSTSITQAITGRHARGITNQLMQKLNNAPTLPYPIGHYATIQIRNHAKLNNQAEYLSLWAGSNVKQCKLQYISDLLTTLITNYNTFMKD